MDREAEQRIERAEQRSETIDRREALIKAGQLPMAGPAITAALAGGRLPQNAYAVTFINHETTNSLFHPTVKGIQDACSKYPCTYNWVGSQNGNVEEMKNAMEAAIAAKVDGIAIAFIDPKKFNELTKEALSYNIPVIGYYVDAPKPPNQRLAYVGENHYMSGYKSFQRFIRRVKPGGHVMLSVPVPGVPNLQPRLDGYIQAIKDAGNPVTYDIVYSGAQAAAQLNSIDTYYRQHTGLAGLFGTDLTDTVACGQVCRTYQLANKGVISGGHGITQDTLDLIASGDLTFATDPQLYQQGLHPVLAIYLYHLSKRRTYPVDITTLALVTKDNVGRYRTLLQTGSPY